MTTCQNCKRPENNAYLCENCTIQLENMLSQLPWLLDELDNRIQQLDRLPHATIGRNRRSNELNIIDFDAAETARNTRKTLLHWVQTITQRHTGRTPPALHTVATKNLARWLHTNTHPIAQLDSAGHLYHDIAKLVGTDHQRHGQLIAAINPHERHLVGPCPTITGRDHNGHPHQCQQTLFADTYDQTTTCPTCHHTINVEQTRRKAAADRDLHTRTDLLELLANIDEPTTTDRLNAWIRARRLRPAGYLHNHHITQHRTHPNAEPVYSLTRARKIRHREHQKPKPTR